MVAHTRPNPGAKAKEYDMFTFETLIRELIDEYIVPLHDRANADTKRVVTTHLAIRDLQTRIVEVE